jgi:ABC-type polysaccharide/polyol phosphate export permease
MQPAVPTGSFMRSLAIQRRVIGALLMREVITRFGRDNLGVLWLVAEPMLFTLCVAALWTASGMNHGSGIPVIAFAVTGYSSILLWRNSVGHCVNAVQANLNLLYHRNVRMIDVLVTRITLETAGATASFIVLTLFFVAVEWAAPPVDLLKVIFGWLMLAWFGASLALTIGALSTYAKLVSRLWQPASYVLFPLSGAAFMVDWLPTALQKIVLLLPMVHGVEMVREGYFGNTVRTHYDMAYMATCCLVLTLTGLFLTHDAARRVEAE